MSLTAEGGIAHYLVTTSTTAIIKVFVKMVAVSDEEKRERRMRILKALVGNG